MLDTFVLHHVFEKKKLTVKANNLNTRQLGQRNALPVTRGLDSVELNFLFAPFLKQISKPVNNSNKKTKQNKTNEQQKKPTTT